MLLKPSLIVGVFLFRFLKGDDNMDGDASHKQIYSLIKSGVKNRA
ncbi:hypothetical protein SAMN02745134_02827 [Clostridium acidisoli DSM 12555]|uniref:Uncharacterized protein n=1 Tax=Clostridium acidisoli DSM 12555 TaxID=1121291 RepID=A0A1W1XR14_9CLOT|nr:hypothetical protein SAMN02745134_02827 [Clostridium acidisoli DSM 12555]